MRFPIISALVPAFVAADALSSMIHDFSSISCSDAEGFSNWLAMYSGQMDSHYKSVYGAAMPSTATDSMHTSMAISSGSSNSGNEMTVVNSGVSITTETPGNSGSAGSVGNNGAQSASATLTFAGKAGHQAPSFFGTGGILGVALAGVNILFM